MSLINVKVAKITQEADGVRSFLLAKKGLFKLPLYEAGSHIDVHCGEGIIRQYSLCGDPSDRHHFQIAVKQVDPSRGGSNLMHKAVREGDRLEIGSPRNDFPLDENVTHAVLLAGGIGITPIIAMADRLQALRKSFELHYFSRGAEHTAFRSRLIGGAYADKTMLHEGLDVVQTSAQLESILAKSSPGAQVYMCGPGPFMKKAEELALKKWPTEAVKLERFAANPAMGGAPTAAFTIELARTGIRLEVGANETILEVLDSNDIDAAFSCEQGVCGTCVTDIIEGEPEHRDSFLSEARRASGKQMCLCVSRAKGDRLVLDI